MATTLDERGWQFTCDICLLKVCAQIPAVDVEMRVTETEDNHNELPITEITTSNNSQPHQMLNAASSQCTVIPTSSYKASYLKLNVIHTVTVTFVKNGPQHFVIQRSNSYDVENLKRLSKELAEFANHNSRTLVNVNPGNPCIAKSSRDQLFHRGMITIVEDMWYAQVYFVDHGYYELVDLQSVFEIPTKLFSIK
jgi:hypothetical protein